MKTYAAPTLLLALLASLSARASDPNAPELVAGAIGLPHVSASDQTGERTLGYDVLAPLLRQEGSQDLSRGISITTFSSGAPAFVDNDPITATQNLVPAFGSAIANYPGSYLHRPNDVLPAHFGGQASMSLGNGVSLNVIGEIGKLPGNSFLNLDPASSLLPRGQTYTHVGGGVSFDLGGGSTLSFSGTVSKSSAGRCTGATFAMCP